MRPPRVGAKQVLLNSWDYLSWVYLIITTLLPLRISRVFTAIILTK
jgi:hypothetical protein